MITLDQIRAQYPGADRLSDDELIGVAAERYGTTPDIFREAIGYKPAPVESPGIIGRAKDLGISALKGAIAVPEAAVGLADLVTGGYAGKAAEAIGFRPKEAKDILSEGYSDAQKRANEEVQKAEGIWDTLKAAVSNPSVLAQTVTESVPSMLGGGIIAGGLIKGTKLGATAAGRVAASGIGEGVVGAGSSAEQIRQQTDDGLLTGKQAAVAGASGVATGALGMLGAKVAKSLGIADVDSMLAGAAQDTVVAKGVARRILEGAVAEGLIEELPQSVQEQVAQNYALGKPLDEGVSQAAVLGTLSGAVMGAGANLLPNKPAIQPPKPPQPPEDKPAAAAPPLMLGNTPDPIIVFPDGTAGRRADLEAYINGLPEDQQVAARAKLMGMGARDATPEDILKAPDADSAITAFSASLTGTDMGAMLGQENPLVTASREMQAQTAADEADLADLVQSEARDLNTLRALTAEDARKQRELDALQATGTGQFGIPPEARSAVEQAATLEAPSIMQLALQRAQQRAAPQPAATNVPEVEQSLAAAAPAPIQRQPDILPGDISREDGMPFRTESGAKFKQRFAGGIDGSEIVPVQGGFVVRPKATPADPAPAAPGQAAGVQPAASRAPGTVDPAQQGLPALIPSTNGEDANAQAAQAIQSPPQRQVPAAGAAPVTAPVPDPGQPAEGGAVPAQAQADPRLIPVSKRGEPAADAALPEDPRLIPVSKRKSAGASNLRKAGYERNPLLAFLATQGLRHKAGDPKSLKTEFSPDKQAMVMGHGPVFRQNGRQLDEILPLAIQDGYLPPGSDEADLANLIASAIRGNRVAPMFTDDGAEKAAALRDQRDREDYERKQAEVFADLDRQASEELEGALADLTDAEFSTLRAELLDGPVADIDAESNTDVRSAMKALGFTDQEIDDATAQGQGAAGQDGASRGGPAETAGQRQGKGAQQGSNAAPAGRADGEGLTDDEANTRAGELIDRHRAEFAKTPSGMTADQFHDYQDRRRDADKAVAAEILKLAGNGDGLLLPWKSGTSLIALHKDPRTEGAWRTTTFLPDMTPAGHMEFNTPMEAAAFFRDSAKGKEPAGLTAPTRADVLRQQDRAENAQALDDKAQIDREAEGFQLQAQTVDTRADTTGDMFGGPSVDDYQQDMARRRKPGTEPQGPSLFDQPEEPQPAAPAAANPDVLRAQADLQNALADLADIFGKNTRANMMPEQEQKMLPVLVKVFDAAFRLGYHKFKDAAKFALDQIRKALGDDAANAITLDHLQGAYISMSGGRPQADTKRAVIDVEDKADIESHVATKGDGPDIVKTYPATAAGTQLQIVRTPDGHNVEMLDTDRGKYMPTIRAFKGEDSLKKAIEFVESPEQNARQERLNVPSPDRSVEPDRAKPAAGPAVGAPVSPGPAGTDQGTGQDGRRAQGQGGGRTGDTRVPADGAAAGGERSDQLFRGDDQPPRSEVVDARTDFGERSGDSGITGVPPEPIPAGKVDAIAVRGDDELRKRGQQVAASKLEAKPGDLANIRETLPYLLPGQQEDVHKAEQRFSKPTGYGMLFTNGTGTGKTFTGLGVIKRFAMQGKKNTLIIVPDDKIAEDWVTSGKALGLDITRLASTKDKGKGIVITTYANMGDNDEIANRKWDLIVPDEAHSLMQSADGTPTSYLQNLRAITHHPDGWVQRFTMQNRDLLAQQKALSDQIIANNKIANLDDTMDVMRESLGRENAKLEAQLAPISKKLNEARDAVRDEVAAMQGEKRARLVFLSATPFAYEKTVDWANGYLFDYKDGYPYTETSLAYNQPNPREHFFMTRFGYSMRYNKLTEPDGTKIDRGLMQRQFNGELKKAGVLSGRMLDVPADYDRRFVLVDSAIGNKIDEALAWLTEKTKGDRNDQAVRGYDALRSVIEGQFDYLSRRYLLEAIKAQEVVPIIKKHMAMGRKVVVFHDYKKGGAVNPFDISSAPAAADAEMAGKVAAFNAANADFRASFPELVSGLKGLRSPIEVFNREFPGVLLINGDEKKADLLRRYKGFQSDDTGPQVMLVQSAKNKGWSGHDTTGKHQRVLINLGQPTAPTLAIQQEGRIYRTGQVSNAIMRYLNTGTNWERWTFASTIASRASTAENLGMGELARALKDSFIASFEESDTYPPGHEGEGTGGKERDKAANNAITEYDRAKTFYWATQKKNSKTKAQEGADYFATPEPVGLKMVQWLDIRPGEGALEPSAGHGAIARWLPDVAKRTVIEPSLALRSRLAMVMNPSEDRIIAGTFEDLAVTNKYDGIAMNPPFGTAGKTAIDHLAKAATHVRDGGRIVALIPTGPAADKKFEKWFYEKTERPIKPLVDLDLGMGKEPLYRGDTIKSVISWQSGVVTGRTEAGMLRVKTGSPGETLVPEKNVAGIARTGQRTESFSPAADLHLIADIKLPQVTFERAGTAVPTRIVVIQKNTDKDAVIPQQRNVDLSDITDIKELFDRLENLDIAKRVIPEAAAPATPGRPARVMSDQEAPAAKPAKAAKAEVNVGDKVTIGGKEYTIEVYTTNAGKEKRGVWMDSREEAQKYSQRTFTTSTNRGKWFVDEYWFPKTPPVASEPGARYSVKEPEAPYETDLFGQPVPAPTGRSAPARPTSTRIRRDVQPAAGVQDTPAPAGEYFASTIVGSEVSRELGASKITTPEQAAQATAYLYKSAVERLDGIVTDANGKPLGIVGGFKGALAQTSVYPATLVAEAVRIPGAARIWFSHNHPSGNPQLSRADEMLNQTLTDVFRGSGIEPMGLLAIGDGRFSHVGNSSGSMISNEPITAPTSRVSVPVIERTLAPNGITGTTISSPQAAKQVARDFYDRAKQPGLMLLNSQNGVIGWVPITDQMKGELRGTGGLNAVYRAISESNAGAAIIVHGGELTHQSIPKRSPQVTPSENIAAALSRIDVRPLDSIEIRPTRTKSAAEIGMSIADGPVFARGNPFYSALTAELSGVNAAAQPALGWANTINGLVKAGKVKQDEVNWSGVLDWLKLQQGKVTREQVVQFLDANGVKVEETVLGGDNQPPGYDADIELLSDNGLTLERNPEDPGMVAFMDENGDLLRADELAEEPGLAKELVLAAYRVQEAAEAGKVPTKYGTYQLPGGTKYREVLLTLPAKPVQAQATSAQRAYFDFVDRMQGEYGDQWRSKAPIDDRLRAAELERAARQSAPRDAANPDGIASARQDRANFRSTHWDQPNILAHIRVNDRTDADGRRVLFVEEIQSDWGQAGKKRGFAPAAAEEKWLVKKPGDRVSSQHDTEAEAVESMNSLARAYGETAQAMGLRVERGVDRNRPQDGVPLAPFVTKTDAWLSLALKRIVKMAVDEGYDRVAFINGEQSAERYSLDKLMNSITAYKRKNGNFNLEGFDVEGRKVDIAWDIEPAKIDDYIGKELAKKIDADLKEADRSKTYSGGSLKVEAKGMRAFYDQIVPSVLKDVLRKVGGGQLTQVGVQVPPVSAIDPDRTSLRVTQQQPGFDITPAMREKAADGLPMFDRKTDLAQLEALLRAVTPRQSQTASAVREMVAPLSDKWDIPVTVVQRPDQLPVPAPSDARGLYHNGQIYLVASNLNSRAVVMRTLGHEAIAHHGLRAMLGREGWRDMMRQISLAVKAGNPAMRKISEYIRSVYVDEDGNFNLSEAQEADEIAAKAVEDGIDPETGDFRPGFGWLKAVFSRVAQFLRDLGITVPMSNTELQGALVRAMRGLEAGAKLQGQGRVMAAARGTRIRRTIAELVDLAGQNSSWKDWYEMHKKAVDRLFGEDAEMFQRILSATSQMQTVKGNVTMALRAYEQMLSGKPFVGYLPAVALNLERIRNNMGLAGPKISEFERGNLGSDEAMAVDRHIAQLLFNTSTPSIPQIEAAKRRIREVAARLGWTPKQTQAALWAANQVRKGVDPNKVVSYDRILEERAERIEEIRATYGRGAGVPTGRGVDAAAYADVARGGGQVAGEEPAGYGYGPAAGLRNVGDIDRAWRDLSGINKLTDYDSTPETKVTGTMDEFVLSREKGKQWAALNVREFRKDDGEVVYSSSLEVGSEEFPRGTGAATTMYLQALNIAKQRGMGWMSEGVRSDAAQAIYRRLTEAGVPFKEVDGSSYVDAAALAKTDLAAVARKVAGDRPMPAFARSAVTGKTITPTWQAPDPTRMDDLLYSMQDKHIDTKRVVTAVRDAIGGIADNLDPYLQEELYHGRAAMATKEFLEKSIRPLLTDMQARGVEMSDFEEYLHNRHAERRNIQVAKVNPNMPDGGSGIKTADARAYLAGLPAAKRTAYQALAKRVDQLNRETRALLVSSGLEKQSTIDAWQAAYGDEYVPLMREEMDNGTTGIGQGFSVRGSSSKRAMGSNKPVANILANIALQREKAITRAEKRRIGEALYGMVLSAPNPDFWFAVDPALEQTPAQITATSMQLISMGLNPIDAEAIAREPRQRYIDPRTGQVAERINPVLRSADNVLAVRIDGEDKYVFFNAQDPRAMRMAKSLKNLDSDQLGTVMGNVAKVTRYFASINTQFNPVFGVVNLTRDIQTALLNLQSTRLAGKQAEVMKHVGSALRGIYIDLRDHRAGKQPTSTWAGLFEEFQREGGATGYRDMYANAQERADAITDELKKIKQGKALEIGRGIFGWLSDYNESMENAVRLATYKVAKEQGMSNQQAASIAKNLTVNFNRKGQVALQAGALYAFFNAAVQGTARMADTMFSGGKLSATGKKIMTGGLLLGSMQALLLAAAGYDDEEPPDFVRERSLVIPIGGDKYVSIPMPLGFHVIPNMARIPTEWAMGGFRDTPKRLAQLVGLFADAFNPIGSAGLSLQTLAPTIIDPLAALAENRDWTGKPIAKKDFNSMQPTAGHTRAKDTATPWARAIAYGVNWVTGGTDYKPGLASPTPDQIDYLIGQATGGVGREASKLSQVASSTVSGEELPLYKIPLLGRFVGTTAGQAAESGRFYENLKEIGEHDAELSGLKKDRRMAEYQEYLRDNPQARLVPIADRTYREVSKLIRMKRDAIKAGASSERVKMLDQQITARMAAFNARVRATETRETATQE